MLLENLKSLRSQVILTAYGVRKWQTTNGDKYICAPVNSIEIVISLDMYVYSRFRLKRSTHTYTCVPDTFYLPCQAKPSNSIVLQIESNERGQLTNAIDCIEIDKLLVAHTPQ